VKEFLKVCQDEEQKNRRYIELTPKGAKFLQSSL
jgi:predicted transcriptional regulator